jgi:hypothetical protein
VSRNLAKTFNRSGLLCLSQIYPGIVVYKKPLLDNLHLSYSRSPLIRGHTHTSNMTVEGINDTTPQLKFIKRMFEAFSTRDFNNGTPFLSEGFSYTALPRIPELPVQTKTEFIEMFGSLFAALTRLDVRILYFRAVLRLTGCPPFSVRFSRSGRGTGESRRPGSSLCANLSHRYRS